MEYALLYTFSTSAQALGGAFALLAAFVLYRFQVIGPTMANHVLQITGNLSRGGADLARFRTLAVQGKWPDVMVEIDRIRAQTNPTFSPDELAMIDRMKATVQLQSDLATAFRRGAIATGAVMAYSVAAIPFAHKVYGMACISWLLLAFGVSGFISCLWLYWKVIKTAIYRQ
jgi:hypothetical protein